MRHILLLPLTLFAASTCLPGAEPELKGTPSELKEHLKAMHRVVSVTGESEVKVPADRAIVTLRLTTESKSLQEALKANQALRARLATTLTSRGIPADRIDTGKFSSTPRHWFSTDKVKSYKVEALVKVAVADDKQMQETARLLDEITGVEYHGIDFEHSNKEEMKRKALSEALQHATARKKVYEEQLGAKLTPLGFAEVLTPTRSPAQAIPQFASPKNSSYAEAFSTTEAPGGFNELVFSARVMVDYLLETK